MGKRELVALLNLSSWCLVMVEQLFLAVPWGCLRFVIVVFPDHTHLLFLIDNHSFAPQRRSCHPNQVVYSIVSEEAIFLLAVLVRTNLAGEYRTDFFQDVYFCHFI